MIRFPAFVIVGGMAAATVALGACGSSEKSEQALTAVLPTTPPTTLPVTTLAPASPAPAPATATSIAPIEKSQTEVKRAVLAVSAKLVDKNVVVTAHPAKSVPSESNDFAWQADVSKTEQLVLTPSTKVEMLGLGPDGGMALLPVTLQDLPGRIANGAWTNDFSVEANGAAITSFIELYHP